MFLIKVLHSNYFLGKNPRIYITVSKKCVDRNCYLVTTRLLGTPEYVSYAKRYFLIVYLPKLILIVDIGFEFLQK